MQSFEDKKEEIINIGIPNHIAIIMDGNGRWAKNNGLMRVEGHKKGVSVVKDIVKFSAEIGLKYLTLYTFSTENWKRSKLEVNALMQLLTSALTSEVKELHDNNVRLRIIGDKSALNEKINAQINNAEDLTKNNKGLNLILAINYGGRDEIVNAAKKYAEDVKCGKASELDAESFKQYLFTADIPDPDLLIRTSGEERLSNFLLYQLAYTEFWFSDKNLHWPDFNKEIMTTAIMEFQKRDRRYGGRKQ